MCCIFGGCKGKDLEIVFVEQGHHHHHHHCGCGHVCGCNSGMMQMPSGCGCAACSGMANCNSTCGQCGGSTSGGGPFLVHIGPFAGYDQQF